MKPLFFSLLLLGAPLAFVAHAADTAPITLHLQLVRGSDSDTPPTPEAHLIGPRLDTRLHGIFKWRKYWEIKRDKVTLEPGTSARRKMSAQRDVEINWQGGKTMTILIWTDGKVTRKRLQTVENTFYIAGGDNDASESWFIIVRRDAPESDRGGVSSSSPSPMP